ncbi:MAG: putative GCN5-like N-acetyltransferase [Candidatus Eremiobacteraeota bacterium]|nr:putative GCN5-like N-acetyltransferase [Candidatus Eremiobacteraeota bacterium]
MIAPTIRIVETDDAAVPAMARVYADAYPVLEIASADALAGYTERMRATLERPGTRYVVAERGGAVLGVMRLYDYTMNVRGIDALTGGVGAVAVSLAHKRQGIARALIAWYLDFYREREAPFAILHPFRPDFYRALGFGYGTPVQRYGFRPAALRSHGARGTVRLLDEGDFDAIVACTERVRRTTNGAIARQPWALRQALGDPIRFVGVEEGGTLRGLMLTAVKRGSPETQNRNRLVVRDLMYEEPVHLAALLGYLRAQQDQFAEIFIETQDPVMYLAADDPRDGSDRVIAPPAAHRVAETALGMMYRVLDFERAFAHLGAAERPLVLRVDVSDAFYAPTAQAMTFRFLPNGAPQRDDDAAPDATLRIGIADLSSVLVGSLALRDVVRHRLASVEPASALASVARAFAADQPPASTARF